MQFGKYILDLSEPQVMGILNVTPDSFSDGGELLTSQGLQLDVIRSRAEAMVTAGASILDIGGESTRPGATLVSAQEELDRVLPVLEMLQDLPVILSLDTSNPDLITAGAKFGAGLINDVRALRCPGALEAAAATGLPVCLMHMQGQPSTMQEAPTYEALIAQIADFLQERVAACLEAGISNTQILLDPGFGFGKTLAHNVELLAGLDKLHESLGKPLLIGVSRKRMLGFLTGGKVEKERVDAGLAAAVVAVMKGACIVRTHDVAPTVDAMKICKAVLAVN